MITTSSILLAIVALSATSSFAAPIRLPVGVRDVAPAPEAAPLGRRFPQAIAADMPGLKARSIDNPVSSHRFPRRVYYEYYARNAAASPDPHARHDKVERAPETPSEPEARSLPAVDTEALTARNKRRETRKRTNPGDKAARSLLNTPGVKVRSVGSKHPAVEARAVKKRGVETRKRTNAGDKAARSLLTAPGVKVRSPGSTSPAVEARAGKKYDRAEPVKLEARTSQPQPRTPEPVVARDTKPQPRSAAPVAQPVARGAKPEEVARDTTYVFGNVITNKHITQYDDVHIHKEGTSIVVEVTPADGTGGTSASGPDTGKANTGNAGTGNAGTSSVLVPGGSSDVKTPSGTPTASATSAASGIVSGTGAPSSALDATGTTPTASGIASGTASGAPSSAMGTPDGTGTGVTGATVTVTVTATPTATVPETNPGSSSVSAAGPSVSPISSDPASSTGTTKLKPSKVKGLSQGATTPLSSGIGDPTVATGTPVTPVKREPGHPWMRMMKRDTTPVTRRRSIIWGR